jgi:hypothetical protein
VIWLVCAAYLQVRPRNQRWSTSKAAYLALAGYGSILINHMVVKVYLAGMHSSSGMQLPRRGHGAGDLPVPMAGSVDLSGQGVGAESARWSGGSPFLGRVQRSNSAVVAASDTSEAEPSMTFGP